MTKLALRLGAAALMGAAIVGCSQKTATAPLAGSQGSPAPQAKNPEPSLTPPAPIGPIQKTTSLTAADVPKSLQTDAYHYYGLASVKPLSYLITTTANPQQQTGTQKFNLTEVANGQAVYRCEFTGYLAQQGVMECTLRSDGVYQKLLSDPKAKPQLQLPSKLGPGVKWSSTEQGDVAGHSIKVTSSNTVVGVESVHTKAGTFQALLVVAQGTYTMDGKSSPLSTKTWLVKDMGPVKVEMTSRTPQGDKTVKTTIEAQ